MKERSEEKEGRKLAKRMKERKKKEGELCVFIKERNWRKE